MARKTNGQTVKFDGKKLKAILNEKKAPLAQIGRDLGYSSNYLYSGLDKSSLNPIVLKFLEAKYDIKPEDYQIIEEPEIEIVEEKKPEVAPITQVVQTALTKEELSDIIYKAVYAATIAAYKDV